VRAGQAEEGRVRGAAVAPPEDRVAIREKAGERDEMGMPALETAKRTRMIRERARVARRRASTVCRDTVPGSPVDARDRKRVSSSSVTQRSSKAKRDWGGSAVSTVPSSSR